MHFFSASLDPDGLMSLLNTNVTTALWVGTVSSASVFSVAITPLDGAAATKVYAPTGAGWQGAVSSGEFVPAAAGIVSFRTDKRGRQYRGRLFVPFVAETVITNGSYTSPMTGGQAAWNSFRTAMKTAAFPLHIASYGHSLHKTKQAGGGFTMTPVTWAPHSTEVTATTVENTLGTMRPRQSRLR